MIRLTAGNDTPFIWMVKLQGQPFDLSGKDVKVYVINSRGEIPVASLNIEGNRVSGVFEGRYQTRLGMHSLALRVNEGRPEMKTATVANAFELVQWSADAGGSEAGDVIFAPVVITSELRIGTGGGGEGGGSYDDTAIWEALNDKVDKEKGKGLSSNDFTNALKEKLEGLENYNDAEISSAVEKLSRDVNALLGDNASAAIESFNEIIAFLEGIEDSASLDAIVASIQQEIAKVSNGLADTDAKLTELEKNKIVVDSNLNANSNNPISNQLFTNSFNYLGSAIKGVGEGVTALETEVSNKEDKPIEIAMSGEPADIVVIDTGVTYYLNKTNIGVSEEDSYEDSYEDYYQKILGGNIVLVSGNERQLSVNKSVHEDCVTFNIAPQFTESGTANGSITIHNSPQISPNGAEYYVEVRIQITANNGGGESGGGSNIEVDAELSDTSENPVQNKIINAKLTELSAEVGKKVDANFVNNAIAEAITNTLNEEV